MRTLSNITIAEFRTILQRQGLVLVRTKGGHETWAKPGLLRPIIFQTHINPIPEFIVRNNLRNLGLSKQDFLSLLEQL